MYRGTSTPRAIEASTASTLRTKICWQQHGGWRPPGSDLVVRGTTTWCMGFRLGRQNARTWLRRIAGNHSAARLLLSPFLSLSLSLSLSLVLAHSLHPSLFLHRRYITPGCLNATHWDAFYDFSQRAGADFIFGVAFGLEQACAGGGATPGPVRTSSAAPGTAYVWNATNAQTLLDYLAAKKQKIWGFEFGEKWRDSNRISRRVLARSLSGFSTRHNCRPVQCNIRYIVVWPSRMIA